MRLSSILLTFSLLLLPSFLLLQGCHIERIVLEEPVTDRFIEVDTEDHVVVRLDEDSAHDYEWRADCADPHVNLTIEHEAGEVDEGVENTVGLATVHIRVRRGFTGPAAVRLRCVRGWSGKRVREIKLGLHRRPTDVAAWR